MLAAPARADQRDDEIIELRRRLEQYERNQDAMRREIEQLREDRRGSPDRLDEATERLAAVEQAGWETSYAGPAGVRRPSSPRLRVGGYFSTQYRSSELPGERGSFVDMRLVPQIHADISPGIAFDTEVEIEHGGVSDELDGEIVVEYAELSFEFSEAFEFKAGTLLVPFGHFNLNHDDPMNELASRPLVARFVSPSAFDLPGIGAEGALEVDDDTVLTYDVILANGFKDEFTSEKGSRDARGLFEEDENHHKTVFGRVAVIPDVEFLDALSVGASGMYGKLGEHAEHDVTGWGLDAQAKLGPWELMGEYDAISIDRAAGTAPPVDPVTGELGPVRGLSGYYVQLLHRFTGNAIKGLPFADGNASMAAVLRFERVDLNDRVHGASPQDDEKAWSIGLNYRPTAKTVLKLEYRFAESGFDGPEGRDRDLLVIEWATYF